MEFIFDKRLLNILYFVLYLYLFYIVIIYIHKNISGILAARILII